VTHTPFSANLHHVPLLQPDGILFRQSPDQLHLSSSLCVCAETFIQSVQPFPSPQYVFQILIPWLLRSAGLLALFGWGVNRSNLFLLHRPLVFLRLIRGRDDACSNCLYFMVLYSMSCTIYTSSVCRKTRHD
jgi:hypothetical protein